MGGDSLFETPVLRQLRECERVLVVGAGGGFDVLSGLPIVMALLERGTSVFLGNLTFTAVTRTSAQQVGPGVFAVDAESEGPTYFPEKHLAVWMRDKGFADRVFLIRKGGTAAVRNAYAWLAHELQIDGLVLVDGGTDLLMTGDEAGLGTPVEDVTSLLAAHALDLPVKLPRPHPRQGIRTVHQPPHVDGLGLRPRRGRTAGAIPRRHRPCCNTIRGRRGDRGVPRPHTAATATDHSGLT
ncbi:DUF1152 domain-containing protein [Nocardia heshunensis]